MYNVFSDCQIYSKLQATNYVGVHLDKNELHTRQIGRMSNKSIKVENV